MRKITMLKWALVFMIVMNVATLATIIYHNYMEHVQPDETVINTGQGLNPLNGKFFKQQLGFDEMQMDVFRRANSHFRPEAFKIAAAIDSLKGEMFTQLQKAAPDSILLNRLSEEVGLLHSSLKKETFGFYLQLKKICSSQQLMQLEKAFRPLFVNDAVTISSGPRKRNGWGKQDINK